MSWQADLTRSYASCMISSELNDIRKAVNHRPIMVGYAMILTPVYVNCQKGEILDMNRVLTGIFHQNRHSMLVDCHSITNVMI
jgi:hypothetical protein